MLYSELVSVYEKVEATAKRIEMADLLAGLFKASPAEFIDRIAYLTQGRLYPDFTGIELGLAEKLVISALSSATGLPEAELNAAFIKTGDLGLVAEDAMRRKKQTSLFHQPLGIERVYGNFAAIASSSGSGSQEGKMKLLEELLHDSSPAEAKYIVRTVLGRLRLGVADMTLIDSLWRAFVKREKTDEDAPSVSAAKDERAQIERAYSVCSDIGLVARTLAEHGMDGIRGIGMKVGVPVRSMLAERLSSIEEIIGKMGGECAFEHKYDGLRIQAHIDRNAGKIELYSRRLESVTGQFPDLVEALSKDFAGKSAILDGEAVPVDLNTGEFLPFQEVSRRRGRKYEVGKTAAEVPVHLFLFDCIFLDGQDLSQKPYEERRKALETAVRTQGLIRFAQRIVTGDAAKAQEFFDNAIESGLEGIVAKSIKEDSLYNAGARGWLWIKYKKDYRSEMIDTVDLAVVGAFAGHGKRAGGYGALLMAAYNPEDDIFETVCKLGSGFDDKTVAGLPARLSQYLLKAPSKKVRTQMKADFWFEPALVAEVVGAEITLSPVHTCAYGKIRKGAGLAVRFPRFLGKWRDDKKAADAITSAELVEMYEGQLKKLS